MGIVAAGGDLNPQTLEDAYTHGIFPWPQPDIPLLWFSPAERGVLFFDDLVIPKSTSRKLKQDFFEIRVNTCFEKVIENCSRMPRAKESGTWLIPEMVQAYKDLHKMGHAISVETFYKNELVGGIYGVLFQGVFSGESMFFKKSEASKVALVHMVRHLESMGHQWMDIQMVTPLLEKFGGRYLKRKDYLSLLKQRQIEFAKEPE